MKSEPVLRSTLSFFLLVVLLSLPFWALGGIASRAPNRLPVNLPLSALMTVCPVLAAILFASRERGGGGVGRLFKRAFDLRRIARPVWLLPSLLTMPAILLASYFALRILGVALPEPRIPLRAILPFTALFFVGAVCEEMGWSSYALDPLQNRWGALGAGLFIGLLWGSWHVLPWFQAHHTAAWVASQWAFTVGTRVLLVWIYNNTGKTVILPALFHAMANVSSFLFPNYGSHYNPAATALIVWIAVAAVAAIWGPRSLSGRGSGSVRHLDKPLPASGKGGRSRNERT